MILLRDYEGANKKSGKLELNNNNNNSRNSKEPCHHILHDIEPVRDILWQTFKGQIVKWVGVDGHTNEWIKRDTLDHKLKLYL